MEKQVQNFILYANKIMGSDQCISDVVDGDVSQLTLSSVKIEDPTPEETLEIFRFTEDTDVEKVLYLFSVLLNAVKNEFCFQRHAEYTYTHRVDLNIYTQYFLYSQIKTRAFMDGYQIPKYFDSWILEISAWYAEYFKKELLSIAYKDRIKGLVLVVTSQFLGPGHAPTELVLRVCQGLIKSERKVFLINLADVHSLTGRILYLGRRANYYREYLSREFVSYEEVDIPFLQCEEGMPNIDMMQALISEIREMKPEIIISVGEDIFSNVIDDMIPVCSLPLENGLCHNFTKYLVHYQDISIQEEKWIKEYGYSGENLIRMNLPYQIIQSNGIEREDLGIPKDVFCLVVIGNRIENELSEDFLEMLERIFTQIEARLLIVGKMDCEKKFANYPAIYGNYIHIEHTEKLLAVCRIADLYVNPPRVGGGTSAIYAMSAGKPIVTLNYGDVCKNCGMDFAVNSVSEMEKRIIQYIEDRLYYNEMSKLALARAKVYEDASSSISNMINILEERESWKK